MSRSYGLRVDKLLSLISFFMILSEEEVFSYHLRLVLL